MKELYNFNNELEDSSIFGDSSSGELSTLRYSNLGDIKLSHTSKGYLSKWEYISNGIKYFVKSGNLEFGNYSNTQPISEYISSEVAKQLGINCVDTKLGMIEVLLEDYTEPSKILVSYTENFLSLGEEYVSMYKLLNDREIRENNLYNLIINKFPEYRYKIDEMILFDFLINNTDRHLNNFGFIFEDNVLKDFSIIFDNGAGFFSDFNITDEMLVNYNRYDRDSKCKPFRTRPYKQIGLIDMSILENINLDIDISSILDRVDLSEIRKSMISKVFYRRLDYVKSLLY